MLAALTWFVAACTGSGMKAAAGRGCALKILQPVFVCKALLCGWGFLLFFFWLFLWCSRGDAAFFFTRHGQQKYMGG